MPVYHDTWVRIVQSGETSTTSDMGMITLLNGRKLIEVIKELLMRAKEEE